MTLLYQPESNVELHRNPQPLQTLKRINSLVDNYLSLEKLCDRLSDLPAQFENPQARPWAAIDWQAINPSQIIGVEPDVFLSVIVGSMKVEAPIRGYAQVSYRYLEKFHPQMARLVGGTFGEDGLLQEIGLWEKEERQHTPGLGKIYQRLTGEKLNIKPSSVKRYVPSDNPREDLYGHGFHRVATEYGATCLYIWLMAHSTGTLQQVLSELVIDEVNHMTKFWGFGLWAFPESWFTRLRCTISQLLKRRSRSQRENTNNYPIQTSYLTSLVELFHTFGRVMGLVTWNSWSLFTKLELIFVFIRVLLQMRHWIRSLTPEYLQQLLGSPPINQSSDQSIPLHTASLFKRSRIEI